MNNRGMTLLEVMFASGILTIVMGAIFSMAIGFGDTARLQHITITGNDDTRMAFQALVSDLRQAARTSINWDELPGEMITYQIPEDLDGNGVAVDGNARIELGTPRIIMRDTEDLNGDGQTTDQLVASDGRNVRVLANHLSPESEQDPAEDPNALGDENGNGQLDRGIWFAPFGRGVRIAMQTQGRTRDGLIIRISHEEIVIPRN
jgi:prepilin-type N-terminal cleavage/methylation domain-containing protein